MAARLFLALVALVGVMWFLAWYQRADSEARNRSLVSIMLYGVAAALLILVITGKIPWLFALFSAATPWINRALSVKHMWDRFNRPKSPDSSGYSRENDNPPGISESKMAAEEAYKILNLDSGASEQEIIDAHRKLIIKNHPDKGGSEFLAAQINQAKDTLLDS
jgi:hypothetical protein